MVVTTLRFIRTGQEETLETILELARMEGDGYRVSDSWSWVSAANCYEKELLACCPRWTFSWARGDPAHRGSAFEHWSEAGIGAVTSAPTTYLFGEGNPRVRATPGGTAYVRIAEGVPTAVRTAPFRHSGIPCGVAPWSPWWGRRERLAEDGV